MPYWLMYGQNKYIHTTNNLPLVRFNFFTFPLVVKCFKAPKVTDKYDVFVCQTPRASLINYSIFIFKKNGGAYIK